MAEIHKDTEDGRRASLRDQDLLEDKGTLTHEEVMKLTELTEEELAIEKKLKRRIDFSKYSSKLASELEQ
jgi:hypothetical protein